MTASGINWPSLGFQMYQCQTTPWDFWQSYQSYLRNLQKGNGYQWYVEFAGEPLLLADNPFTYDGKLTRDVSGRYTVRVIAKSTQSLFTATAPEDCIEVYYGVGNMPNSVMMACDESLTPRLADIKGWIEKTLYDNEKARWDAKAAAAAAEAEAASAAGNLVKAAALKAEADRLAAIVKRDEATRAMQIKPTTPSPIDEKSPASILPDLPPVGVASDGQAPWDTQEDVTPADQIMPVAGTIVGEGYTPTVGEYPAGFLTWLNLKVPNAEKVKTILADETMTEEYLRSFNHEAQANFQPGLPGATNPSVPSFPNAYSFEKLENSVWPGAITDGPGFEKAQAPAQTYVQEPPKNYFDGSQSGQAPTVDSLQDVLDGRGTDFLNMLAIQYRETLSKIANIAKARQEVSYLIDTSKWGEVQSYLQDFDASRYAVAATAPTPVVVKKAELIPGLDMQTALIGLGVLAGVYFVMKKGKL